MSRPVFHVEYFQQQPKRSMSSSRASLCPQQGLHASSKQVIAPAAPVSAQKPVRGFGFVSRLPIVWTIRHPPKNVLAGAYRSTRHPRVLAFATRGLLNVANGAVSANLRRVDAERLRDLRCRLVRPNRLDGHFGLQAGRMVLSRSGH
jgi:hypothetical protein